MARPLDAAAVQLPHELLSPDAVPADAAVEPRAALALAAPASLKGESHYVKFTQVLLL